MSADITVLISLVVAQQAAVSLEARPCDRLPLELELQVHGGGGDADRLEGAGGNV